jgi:hypothetical protein
MTRFSDVKTSSTRSRACVAAALTVGAIALAFASPAAASFGVEAFENSITINKEGAPATQAGSHPYAMTTTIVFNHHASTQKEEEEGFHALVEGNPKDLEVSLPAGLVVNLTATETKCTEAELEDRGLCPQASAVGTVTPITAFIHEPGSYPIFKMVPQPGAPGELGFNISSLGIVFHIVGNVGPGPDYRIVAQASNITEWTDFYASKLTLWGDPSAASHDRERGFCSENAVNITGAAREAAIKEGSLLEIEPGVFSCPTPRTGRPLLTMPGSCTGKPLVATMTAYSWQEPNSLVEPAPVESPAVTGCGELGFSPAITVQPDTAAADSPSGLLVDLKVPNGEESANGLAEANLKDAVVTLPAGMAVSPSAANGLGACTPEEIGLSNANVPSCPDSSKVAEAEVTTPLLEHPLRGSVFLAQQGNNPFGSLIALYLVVEGSGVVIKIPGEVSLDPATGQVTATFADNPQLPFSELKLTFFGGPRAALVTPPACGTYTTTTQLTPWSAPFSGPPATSSDSFQVNQGCHGPQFAPSFTAGTDSSRAGAFSPFSLTLSRADADQQLSDLSATFPPGLLAKLAGVPLCGAADANAGTCPAASRIGSVTVGAGPGPDPVYVQGSIYLTGSYKGAPFGESVVVPAIAGPFNLGTVVVRGAIYVNPSTAQASVVSDPFPTILQGVPLQVKTVHVQLDREGFVFNPTSCAEEQFTGAVTGVQGASAAVSSPFQAANCATLPFKPGFTASTVGRASKASGASLDVKVTSKGGPGGGGEANIKSVKVDLPKQLPSRLTTLQKACLAKVFESNPASCSKESDVGTATAKTPVLANPLSGPAYLVSHGGAAFPDLEIVLQGEGVVLVLDGHTDIKKGITSSTFNTVPDAPITSFELKLPTGKYSILGAYVPANANYNLCGQTLAMPTAITGQNGAVVKQTTKIAVTGCPKPKKAAKKKAKKATKASHGNAAHRRGK